jgi:shikimate dehydrogenase
MKLETISNQTKIFGILGFPLSHTLSPIIHNTLYKDMNLNAVYLVLQKENPTKEEILGLHKYGVRGLSVTIPYKEWAFQIADEKDASSSAMKSANTLVLNNNRIFCYNTDGLGAVRAVKDLQKNYFISKKAKDILILGSGGSARGIAFAIQDEIYASKLSNNKKIILSARNETTAKQIVNELNLKHSNTAEFVSLMDLFRIQNQVGLVIHTTPLGMKGQNQTSLIPESFFSKEMIVFDIVYNPKLTEFLKIAKKKKSKIIYGIEMLLHQAIRQHELFTSTYASASSIKKIRKKLYKILSQ